MGAENDGGRVRSHEASKCPGLLQQVARRGGGRSRCPVLHVRRVLRHERSRQVTRQNLCVNWSAAANRHRSLEGLRCNRRIESVQALESLRHHGPCHLGQLKQRTPETLRQKCLSSQVLGFLAQRFRRACSRQSCPQGAVIAVSRRGLMFLSGSLPSKCCCGYEDNLVFAATPAARPQKK